MTAGLRKDIVFAAGLASCGSFQRSAWQAKAGELRQAHGRGVRYQCFPRRISTRQQWHRFGVQYGAFEATSAQSAKRERSEIALLI